MQHSGSQPSIPTPLTSYRRDAPRRKATPCKGGQFAHNGFKFDYDSVLDAASATTSRVDAEELGGVMTEKKAELFAESATEEHALRPVRRRRLDS